MKSSLKPYYLNRRDYKYRELRNIDNIDPDLEFCMNRDEALEYRKHNYDTIQSRLDECRDEAENMLDLSHMDLDEIPNIPSSVTFLNISHNKITRIRDDIVQQLQILDCRYNMLTELPPMPNLRELICSHNKIESLKNINQSLSIERIDCSHNNIKEINNFNNLPNLRVIIASYNKLKLIDGFNFVEKMLCDHNDINDLFGLAHVKYLNCSNNQIKNLPEMHMLEYLFCSNNYIVHLPRMFRVVTIQCDNNDIERVRFYSSLKELLCDKEFVKKISKRYTIGNASIIQKKYILYEMDEED